MKAITRISNLLEDFVLQKGMKNKLVELFVIADERQRAGFEKWLQFELVLFLRNHGGISEVKLEKKVGSDKRTDTDKVHFQTDIVVTIKSGDSFGLELKVRRRASGAERALWSDLRKHQQTVKKDKATANFSIVLCGEDIDEARQNALDKTLSNFGILNIGNSVCFLVAEEP